MSAYNHITAHLQCPRCGKGASMTVDLYFGLRDQTDYKLGEIYRWRVGRSVQNGGRPSHGDLDGEGYAECPICRKDFFLVATVRGDVLENVQPDPNKKPLIQ